MIDSGVERVKTPESYNVPERLQNTHLIIDQAARTGKLECAL